ncbi:MAG TPA: lamin tail domain-containing protein, partial [Bacteroidales bacterium]|nr:lamin tail domain-containing protein [Bacteroidales bacterium]
MRPSGLFLLPAFLLLPDITESQVIINEIMAANANSLIETDYFNLPDWLEIYHNGTSAVNLSDYYLSDDKDELKKWQFPSTALSAGQYCVVYCDKEGIGKHTTFGLSADGETLYLCDKSGTVIDYVQFGKQYPDVSYGRNPANPDRWLYCSKPTPGGVNSVTTATVQSPGVVYSIPAGRLNSPGTLTLTGNGIIYTTWGAEPDSNSLSYSKALTIPYTLMVKSKTFLDAYLPGETYANTYFLNEHDFTLPVVSLSFTPEYFYDNTIGIHVRGTNGTEGDCGSVANWNQDWERAAYLEYFDEYGIKQISQPVGVKLAGGCTRGRD